ncbi:DUF4329 domain-containing protein [Burkholderia contaminans]|uniref:DUF4329 domain-containing protein n=2 Tax=Burkholderia contaminans TaxID=488447 RepID=A0A3N8PW18_9BURK|nr:DUF4329 domain-containing protein [Burkholderia contaminans]
MVQATHAGWIPLHERPDYDEHYDIDRDPLWSRTNRPVAFGRIGYYQCDQIGTPQEVTDEQGEIAWSARYRAWGEAKEVISEAARKAGVRNPIRFQGQYFDHETGLHYNRYRYYDPQSGRFVSKDPIGLAGGLNPWQYANNPIHWTDPVGLARTPHSGGCADTAARSALNSVMGKSVRMNKEFGGLIYQKAGRYFATIPVPGTGRTFVPALALPQVPKGATIVGDYHTHGDYSVQNMSGEIVRTSNPARDDFDSDNFSVKDNLLTLAATAKNKCHRSYLGTPRGKIKVFTVAGGSREL